MQAKKPEAYFNMVEQALFEVEDLRAAIEYESSGFESAQDYLEPLETELKAFRQRFLDGEPVFGEKDLKYVALVKDRGIHELPFLGLLLAINQTYRKGLDVDGD